MRENNIDCSSRYGTLKYHYSLEGKYELCDILLYIKCKRLLKNADNEELDLHKRAILYNLKKICKLRDYQSLTEFFVNPNTAYIEQRHLDKVDEEISDEQTQ